ncbi:hypothetical protein OE88DRAFT_1647976 [Heliocybe sulcata]|uniref:Uncharacterized protein n=1 Tax=Heliocybe sulcata TaxID=5364 RepID=A0A5C3MQI4_9AGAM|nr:hypothetical protein OE88DRAFT_1647976 [Heliocybe sulcata]
MPFWKDTGMPLGRIVTPVACHRWEAEAEGGDAKPGGSVEWDGCHYGNRPSKRRTTDKRYLPEGYGIFIESWTVLIGGGQKSHWYDVHATAILQHGRSRFDFLISISTGGLTTDDGLPVQGDDARHGSPILGQHAASRLDQHHGAAGVPVWEQNKSPRDAALLSPFLAPIPLPETDDRWSVRAGKVQPSSVSPSSHTVAAVDNPQDVVQMKFGSSSVKYLTSALDG